MDQHQCKLFQSHHEHCMCHDRVHEPVTAHLAATHHLPAVK